MPGSSCSRKRYDLREYFDKYFVHLVFLCFYDIQNALVGDVLFFTRHVLISIQINFMRQ